MCTKKSLQEYLQGEYIKNEVVKRKLIEEGYKKHQCETCLLSEWLKRPIPLELHHVDGNSSNYDIGNLKLLCPNCHAFTENYRGKGKGKQPTICIDEKTFVDALSSSKNIHEALIKLGLKGQGGNYKRAKSLVAKYNISFSKEQNCCIDCGTPITEDAIRCEKCYAKKQSMCCISRDELKALIRETPFTTIANMYGVSDNAIRKWCVNYLLPRNKNRIKKFTDEEWSKI